MSSLGQRIGAVRAREKLSQAEFADRLGFSRRSLMSWESGQADPPTTVLIQMRKQFDVAPEWILLGADLNPQRHFNQIDWAAYDDVQAKLTTKAKKAKLCLPDKMLVRLSRMVFSDGTDLDGPEGKKVLEYMRMMAEER